MKGFLIILEGPDGSGTTRHSDFLAERLRKRGIEVLLTAEPTASPIGQQIRTILHGETMPAPEAVQLLFTADRAEHVQNVIEPALKSGKVVICDRYILSTLIYGSVLGVDRAWLESANSIFPKPDLTIITLPPFEVCAERIDRRGVRDQLEGNTFQRQVYDAYKAVEDPKGAFVDTSGDKEAVANEIERIVQETLPLDALLAKKN